MSSIREGAVIHLTNGPSGEAAIRKALDAAGRRDEVVEFFDRYSEGPLTDIDDGAASRVRWWEQLYGERLSPSEARKLDDRTTWRRLRADTRTVVVWHGPHPSDWLHALRASWHLREQIERVHEVVLRPAAEAHAPWLSVGSAGTTALVAAWAQCSPVDDGDERARAWEQVKARPGESIYELRGSELVPLQTDAHDASITAACGDGWSPSARVLLSVLGEHAVGDVFLSWRLRELLRRGVLEGRGAILTHGVPSEVRRVRQTG